MGCVLRRLKNPICYTTLHIAERRKDKFIHAFFKCNSKKLNANILVCDLNSVQVNSFTTVLILFYTIQYHQVGVIAQRFSDSLSPYIPIIHFSWPDLLTTSSVRTELLYVSPCWSANTDVTMRRSLLKKVAYEFILTSLAVPRMSCLLYLDGL